MAGDPKQGKKGRGQVTCLAEGRQSERYSADNDEMIVVLEGEGTIEGGQLKRKLRKGDSIFIRKGSEYRLKNASREFFIYARIMKETKGEAG